MAAETGWFLSGFIGEVPHVAHLRCEELLAYQRLPDTYNILYIKLSGSYHRFVADDDGLSWHEGILPDADCDLDEGEYYADFTDKLAIRNRFVSRITMNENGIFSIYFEDGYRIELKYSVDLRGATLHFAG